MEGDASREPFGFTMAVLSSPGRHTTEKGWPQLLCNAS